MENPVKRFLLILIGLVIFGAGLGIGRGQAKKTALKDITTIRAEELKDITTIRAEERKRGYSEGLHDGRHLGYLLGAADGMKCEHHDQQACDKLRKSINENDR